MVFLFAGLFGNSAEVLQATDDVRQARLLTLGNDGLEQFSTQKQFSAEVGLEGLGWVGSAHIPIALFANSIRTNLHSCGAPLITALAAIPLLKVAHVSAVSITTLSYLRIHQSTVK
jgi:hypothetical protein